MTESEKNKLFAALKEKYNPEGSKLRQYQLHLLDTLKEFDAFCRAHGIVYYLAYGTLLGAVRHKGFIPWDDDADLWMDRENYTKLEKLMRGNHHQLTENVYVTEGIRPELWSPPYAYIDIFILDGSPDNAVLRTIKEWAAKFLYVMIKCRGRIDSHNLGKFKLYFVLLPLAYMHSIDVWKKKYKRVSQWFPKRGRMVQVFNEVFTGIKRRYPSDDEVWKPVEMEFEGNKYFVPQGWDTLLTIRYGDYMTLPKENERLMHGENITVGSEQITIGEK